MNCLARVPTTALTVTVPNCSLSVLGVPIRHDTVVPDVHDVVWHCSPPDSTAVLGVNAYDPKFSPEIVTDVPMLAAEFG